MQNFIPHKILHEIQVLRTIFFLNKSYRVPRIMTRLFLETAAERFMKMAGIMYDGISKQFPAGTLETIQRYRK